MRALGKKVLFHYHGSEVRGRNVASPFVSIVSTPDLMDWVAGARWIPNPVDLEIFKPGEAKYGEEFVIGFYGSDPINCPKDAIRSAVKTVEQRGHRIVLLRSFVHPICQNARLLSETGPVDRQARRILRAICH